MCSPRSIFPRWLRSTFACSASASWATPRFVLTARTAAPNARATTGSAVVVPAGRPARIVRSAIDKSVAAVENLNHVIFNSFRRRCLGVDDADGLSESNTRVAITAPRGTAYQPRGRLCRVAARRAKHMGGLHSVLRRRALRVHRIPRSNHKGGLVGRRTWLHRFRKRPVRALVRSAGGHKRSSPAAGAN